MRAVNNWEIVTTLALIDAFGEIQGIPRAQLDAIMAKARNDMSPEETPGPPGPPGPP